MDETPIDLDQFTPWSDLSLEEKVDLLSEALLETTSRVNGLEIALTYLARHVGINTDRRHALLDESGEELDRILEDLEPGEHDA